MAVRNAMNATHRQKLSRGGSGKLGPVPRLTSRLEQKLCTFSSLASLYERIYRDVIAREVGLAEITERDRVVNVGCGAAPFTGVLIARAAGAEVTCVERDAAAAARAQRRVSRLGMDQQVAILNGDAVDGVPEFDVAVVALQVSPKREVLRVLADCGAPGARVVVREPALWCRDMYDPAPDCLRPGAEVRHRMGALDRSVLHGVDGLRVALLEVP